VAKLRVLAEAPPPARGYVENQIREMRDYLTRLKDELEFLLTHLGEDNLNRDFAEIVGRVPDLEAQLGEKQDAEQVEEIVSQAIRADDSLVRLFNTATDVSTDTTLALSAAANGFTLLIIYGHAGGTTAGYRFCIAVPTVALGNSFFVPAAANNTLGALRLGLTDSDWTKLRIISQTFSSMQINSIYGRR
jgi:hypothetical protein